MTDLIIKQGATLQLLLSVKNDDNSAFDLTGTTVASQVRDLANRLIATLTLTPTGDTGVLSVTQATSTWPTGPLQMDIKVTQGSIVLKTATQTIVVEEAVTE